MEKNKFSCYLLSYLSALLIIATNCNSGPMEILSKGKGGTLIKKGDYNDISKKIEEYLIDDSVFMKKSKYCFKKLKRFSYNNFINKYDNFFTNI